MLGLLTQFPDGTGYPTFGLTVYSCRLHAAIEVKETSWIQLLNPTVADGWQEHLSPPLTTVHENSSYVNSWNLNHPSTINFKKAVLDQCILWM